MIDPDRLVGPWRLRVWGLILNFIANAVALFGIVQLVETGRWGLLAVGTVTTIVCVLALAIPSEAP